MYTWNLAAKWYF